MMPQAPQDNARAYAGAKNACTPIPYANDAQARARMYGYT